MRKAGGNSRLIKVQAEEVLIGVLAGAGLGMAVCAPFVSGLPDPNPLTASGLVPFLQAALLWSGAVVGAVFGGAIVARQERDTHVRGARYLPDFEAAGVALQGIEAKRFSAAQTGRQVSGIKIGGVELSRESETGHFYVVGLPGAGKSTLLNSLIDQVLERNDRIIIHDPKGEYTERYYDPATCVLLGPWDDRAAIWDGAADIDSPPLADEFGADLAGSGEGSNAGQNQFFHDGAAGLIAGLIRSYQSAKATWAWTDLRDALQGDPVDLIRQAARGNPGVKQVMPSVFTGQQEPGLTVGEMGVLSTLGTSTSWVSSYASVDAAARKAPRFSLRRWLLGEDHLETRVVILNTNAMYAKVGEAIVGAMFKAIVATASSAMPEKSPDADGGIWCILDEFPQLGAKALAQVQHFAELGRSRGIRVVTAMQDETQLAAIVGREKAAPMLAVQNTKVYMKSSDETAKAVSARLGKCDVNRIETIAENGALAGKTMKLVEQLVVQPSDLLGLGVRKQEAPLGAMLIMHINDTLGRLVHPFPERRPPRAAKFVKSELWERGGLPDDLSPSAGGGDDGAAGAQPQRDDGRGTATPECPAPPPVPFDGSNGPADDATDASPLDDVETSDERPAFSYDD